MVLLMRRKDWNTYRGNNSKNGLAAQTTVPDYGFFGNTKIHGVPHPLLQACEKLMQTPFANPLFRSNI